MQLNFPDNLGGNGKYPNSILSSGLNDFIPPRPHDSDALNAVKPKWASEIAVIFHDNSSLAVIELHVKWGQGSG